MKTALVTVAAVAALSAGLTACGNKERSATADTGTATAKVTTEAPASAVPDAQLQQQAQQAATASSTPVDGSPPVSSTSETPPIPAAAPAPKK